ncbi:hypothetical protein WJX79_010174 [Trebouxia sp. C0005]
MHAVRCHATKQQSEHLFVIGLGYTGRAISNTARKSGRIVSGTCRGLEQQDELRAQGLHAIQVDDGRLQSKEMLAILEKATHLLCAIPPSTLDTQVVELLAASAPSLEHLKWVGYLSTTSVYGDWSGDWVDESCAIRPASVKAKQRAETEAAWLSLHQQHKLPVHCFRLGGIYGPGRSALDAAQQQGVASASQQRRGLQRLCLKLSGLSTTARLFMTGSRQKGCVPLAVGRGSTAARRSATTPLAAAQQADGGLASQEAGNAAGSRRSSVREKPAAKNATVTQRRGPHARSSAHRGVTQHRRTRKWEAHIWDDRHQIYLGGFNSEEDAARAHDVMAIKCRGADSITNYSPDDYSTFLPQLQKLTKDEVRQLLMRKSSSFARGVSKYRGVTKHKGGKWEARLGQSKTSKHSYLGLFDSEEDAAKAYDTATINRFGHGMPVNFDLGQMTDIRQFATMRGTDAHNQQLFDQSNVTCDTVHVQYGIASDDSQNDCTDDEPDSASSDSNYGDHSFAAQQGPYSLPDAAADMYNLQMTHNLVNGSEELLHRPESSSPVLSQGLGEAGRQSPLLFQAGQPMPELPQWVVDCSNAPRLGCFAAPGVSAVSGCTPTPTQWTAADAESLSMQSRASHCQGSAPHWCCGTSTGSRAHDLHNLELADDTHISLSFWPRGAIVQCVRRQAHKFGHASRQRNYLLRLELRCNRLPQLRCADVYMTRPRPGEKRKLSSLRAQLDYMGKDLCSESHAQLVSNVADRAVPLWQEDMAARTELTQRPKRAARGCFAQLQEFDRMHIKANDPAMGPLKIPRGTAGPVLAICLQSRSRYGNLFRP